MMKIAVTETIEERLRRKKGSALANSLIIETGNSQQQGFEAAGHIASTIRKQRMMHTWAQLIHFNALQDCSLGILPSTLKVSLFTFIDLRIS